MQIGQPNSASYWAIRVPTLAADSQRDKGMKAFTEPYTVYQPNAYQDGVYNPRYMVGQLPANYPVPTTIGKVCITSTHVIIDTADGDEYGLKEDVEIPPLYCVFK